MGLIQRQSAWWRRYLSTDHHPADARRLVSIEATFTPNWSERGIDVKIELTKLSGSVIPSIRVTRSADIDAAGVNSPNVFQMTNDSALGMGVSVNPKNYFLGLMLTAASGASGQGLAWNSTYSEWNPWGNGSQYARGCVAGRAFGGTGGFFANLTNAASHPTTCRFIPVLCGLTTNPYLPFARRAG
jgi:hypothetical protein